MWIDANFDGGNIEVVSVETLSDIQLKIRPDSKSDHAQWFYFRILGAKGRTCQIKITNAGDAAYPEAWDDGSIVYSTDHTLWRRSLTTFDGQMLSFQITCESDVVYIALSPPYLQSQHNVLIAKSLHSEFCNLHATPRSAQGRPIEVLKIGNPNGPKIWIIARQHPGEPMAEWYIDGLLDRLLNKSDAAVEQLRRSCQLFIVPNMNPDGSVAGNLRTNAIGVDLNRAWAQPCKARSPEVFGVLNLMQQTGVDLFLDIHGDEELQFVFAAGSEGNPGYTQDTAKADRRFRQIYHETDPEFSVENGYEPDAPGTGDLSIACNQIAHQFGCLSLTIELPFKDNAKRPDPIEGWSIARSKSLGASLVPTLCKYFDT